MTHSQQAALRGEPSYVWRQGQERRLQMIATWSKLENAHILVNGCGIGMYAAKFRDHYSQHVEAFDIEAERVEIARQKTPHALIAAAERPPYPAHTFDTVLSNEVLEHVLDDRATIAEMIRVLKPGGRTVIFTPNRWYPFETHGHYWRGVYHFGNTPLINYLPDMWRDKLVPHVRAYTKRGLLGLFDGLPAKVVHYDRIYGGYDNIIARTGTPGRVMRDTLYKFEGTPLNTWGLSHFLVVEKTP